MILRLTARGASMGGGSWEIQTSLRVSPNACTLLSLFFPCPRWEGAHLLSPNPDPLPPRRAPQSRDQHHGQGPGRAR